MSSHPISELPDERRLGVSWWTVGLFALLLAAADGFWATSVRGAVGFIQNVDQPFHDWLFYLAVMLPIFAATVYLAIRLAQRFGRDRSGIVRVTLAAALVVVLTTVVAIAQISLTAVYDYHSQQAQIALMHHIHNENGPTVIRLDPGVTVAPGQPSCIGLCAEKQQTIDVHYRAIRLAALLILLTNTVLVLWALALRGGRLWARRRAVGSPAVAPDADGHAPLGAV
jgi:hypothetical protein